jgi:hypothetical protein
VSSAVAIVVAAIALACPLHMLWRLRHGRRACCPPARDGAAAGLGERQRALAARVDSLVDSAGRHESAPERH